MLGAEHAAHDAQQRRHDGRQERAQRAGIAPRNRVDETSQLIAAPSARSGRLGSARAWNDAVLGQCLSSVKRRGNGSNRGYTLKATGEALKMPQIFAQQDQKGE